MPRIEDLIKDSDRSKVYKLKEDMENFIGQAPLVSKFDMNGYNGSNAIGDLGTNAGSTSSGTGQTKAGAFIQQNQGAITSIFGSVLSGLGGSPAPSTASTTYAGQAPTTTSGSKTWIWIVVAIIVIILIFFIVKAIRKK